MTFHQFSQGFTRTTRLLSRLFTRSFYLLVFPWYCCGCILRPRKVVGAGTTGANGEYTLDPRQQRDEGTGFYVHDAGHEMYRLQNQWRITNHSGRYYSLLYVGISVWPCIHPSIHPWSVHLQLAYGVRFVYFGASLCLCIWLCIQVVPVEHFEHSCILSMCAAHLFVLCICLVRFFEHFDHFGAFGDWICAFGIRGHCLLPVRNISVPMFVPCVCSQVPRSWFH